MNMSRMGSVQIDPRTWLARAEAGARWMDVTPVAGKHGLAPNSAVAVEVVTADGAVRSVCDYDEPKLFWALRGGGMRALQS